MGMVSPNLTDASRLVAYRAVTPGTRGAQIPCTTDTLKPTAGSHGWTLLTFHAAG